MTADLPAPALRIPEVGPTIHVSALSDVRYDQTESDSDPPDPRPRSSTSDRLITGTTWLGVVALFAAAFVISYRHLFDLAVRFGQSPGVAWLWPITVDVLMIVGSAIMLHASRRQRPVPVLSRVALLTGVAATIIGNGVSGIMHGWGGITVAAWPAVALTLAYHLMMWLVRDRRHQPDTEPQPDIVEKIVYRDREVPVEVVREVPWLPRDRHEAAEWEYAVSLDPGQRRIGRRMLASHWGITEREAEQAQANVDTQRLTQASEQASPNGEVVPPEGEA